MSLVKFFDAFIKHGFEMFGKYYSCYRGYVVDNEDPENLDRLLIRVPEIANARELPNWALPFNLYSGEGYGLHNLPSKGDLIWVQFEKGNPNYPLWSFSYYGKNEKPDEFKNKSVRGFKTPFGHVIYSDDDKDNPFIKIKHQNELSIVINNRGISLGLKDNKLIYLGDIDQAKEFILLGETTKKELEKSKVRIDLLYQAIQSGVTAANDGGANYKATMTTILSGATAEDYSNILSNKVKTE